MADIGISSNSGLTEFSAISGGDTTSSCLNEDTCNGQSTSRPEQDYVADCPVSVDSNIANEPVPGSSKEPIKQELPDDNHSVWIPSAPIKSEIEDQEEKDSGSGEDEESENEAGQEEKMEEQSDSEDEEDSEGGAYHLAEVSYGEEDEPEKRKGAESDSILGLSHDVYKPSNPGLESSDLVPPNTVKKLTASDFIIQRKNKKIISKKSGKIRYPGNYVCTICGQVAACRRSLLDHVHKHTGEKIHLCLHCNKTFRYRSYLIQHITINHTDSAQYTCSICGQKFVKQSVYTRHQLVHTGERPFPCTHCNYQARTQGALKDHLRKHTGEKPYMCKECDYKCAYSTLLKRHIAAQHEKQTFLCDKCDYKTNIMRNLKKHMKVHTLDKVLFCDKCDYKTHNKEFLKNHIVNRHLGGLPKKDYQCTYCEVSYRERRAWKRHIEKHEEGKSALKHAVDMTSADHVVDLSSAKPAIDLSSAKHAVDLSSAKYPEDLSSANHAVDLSKANHVFDLCAAKHVIDFSSAKYPVDLSSPHEVYLPSANHAVDLSSENQAVDLSSAKHTVDLSVNNTVDFHSVDPLETKPVVS